MRHHRDRHAGRPMHGLSPLLVTLSVFLAASIAFAAAVGDQVELKATHQAGIPFHQEPRGTDSFQRIPDGTRAQVIEVVKNGQWLKLSLPDGRTGWVTSRYVRSSAPGAPSSGTSPTGKTPQRTEEGIVERVADGDTLTVITPNQTKLRIRMFGIDAPETPKGAKFPGQPYGPEAEVYLRQLVEG
jgi:Bacterial SH3 domain